MIRCEIRNAKGERCALDEWHDSAKGWMRREHRTASGQTFTYMGEREINKEE